uniref:NACHT domain-containing protein n=1 Tax=Erpetoichthys calabaricus TaxID=27687 RepID=A0A8C4ST88_ERPCA
MRPTDDQLASGDSHISAVGLETRNMELMVIKQDIKDELVKVGKTQEKLGEKGATKNCERIWTEQLFRRNPDSVNPSNIVVVSGVAGIGKTTMVKKIMSDWARGTQYQRFRFVFLFKLRKLNLIENDNETQESLTKFIVRHYKHLSNESVKEILQNPESLLFILDGLEEYKYKLNFTDTQLCSDPDDEVPVHILVTSLVSQTLLKGCSVLITSRPTALGSLDMEKVDGFADTKAFWYFEERVHRFYVEENAILYTMCFNPSYCWIICSALKSHFMTPEEERGAAPRTVTEIFVMFLHNILTSHRQETEDQILLKLGKMAYYGVENNIHEFNEKQEMSNFSLQPVLSSPFLSGLLQRQSTQEHTTYIFYHLTLQEFMAACSVYRDSPEGTEELLKKLDLCKDGQFEIVTRFMAGLAWCPVLKTLEGILGEFEGTTTQRIQEWVRQKAKQALRGQDKSEAVRVCHWLYETQNEELIRDTIGEDLNMIFTSTTLYPLDCNMLAYVISCCGKLQKLDLSQTPLTPQGVLHLPVAERGQGLIDVRSKIEAFRLQMLQRLFYGPDGLPWRDLAFVLLHKVNELKFDKQLLLLDVSKLTLSFLPKFYQSMLITWHSKFRRSCFVFGNLHCFLEEPLIWNNVLKSPLLCSYHFTSVLINTLPPLLLCLILWLRSWTSSPQDTGSNPASDVPLESLHLPLCSAVLSASLWMDITVSLNYCTVVLSVCLSVSSQVLSFFYFCLHSLRSCRLTVRCCSALSSVLSAPNSRLTELRLGKNNNMEDSGVEQLCEGLRSPNCKLKTLSVCVPTLLL